MSIFTTAVSYYRNKKQKTILCLTFSETQLILSTRLKVIQRYKEVWIIRLRTGT